MVETRQRILALAILATCAFPPPTHAVVIATSKGIGADAEVRDHQPGTNFGASTELATRVLNNFTFGHTSDGSDRFSAMYLKFDITGQAAVTNQITSVRLTYRNPNFLANRLTDTTPPGNNTAFRTGLAFYGLDREHAGNSWGESTINYSNAPGLVTDNNNGTKDFDFVDPDGAGPLRAPLTFLGAALFPALGAQNHLPVGGEMVFSNDALNTFLTTSLNAAKTSITIVAAVVHDGYVPVNDWRNFNYLFNPKEQTTLLTDPTYDADTLNSTNPLGSPWSGASNATNGSGFSPFSPQLIFGAAGDFNFDSSVNTADYVTWRKIDGTPFGYNTWRSRYGNTAASGAGLDADSATVPEPGCALLLMFGASISSCRRIRIAHHA